MKRILFTLVLVAAFAVTSLLWDNHVYSHSQSLIDTVDRAIEALNRDRDFLACGELMDDFSKKWQHMHNKWETLIAHQKLMNIEISLAQARWAIADKDQVEALMQLAALKVALQHLADSHSLSLANLL